ncbi:MAG: hypothetical protein HKN13_04600, partial [Rhodothermales bacterium]|nr:hypothetical protein [Rhodothermales bacterium]
LRAASTIYILIAFAGCGGYDTKSVETANWVGERTYPSNQTRPWSWEGSSQKILNWTPESDPDADYNRGTVPLKARFTNPAYWANDNARDEGRVAVTTPWYVSEDPNSFVSYGADYFDMFTYTYWQYLDVFMVFNNWNSAMSAELFDVAHRNGVEVYNLIMNPPAGEVEILVQQDDQGRFPGADKLIEIAEFYGFDGWFFNLEAPGTTALARQLRDFFIYFNKKGNARNVRAMMYDSWTEAGDVDYQNELNERNDWYFHHEDRAAAHEYYLNYWYDQKRLADSRDLALSYGRDPYDVFAGFETWFHYWKSGGDLKYPVWDIFPTDRPYLLSLACFQMNGARDVASDNADYYIREGQFISGMNNDPTNTSTGHEWQGLAHYYPARSVINSVPFVTNFNTGHGHLYAVDGDVRMRKDWYNRGIQDILPTWRWIVVSEGSTLKPEFAWTDAFYGGSSLRVSGRLESDNLIKLFMTHLPVTTESSFVVAFKSGRTEEPTHMNVSLSFEDEPDEWVHLDVGSSDTPEWNTRRLDLSGFAGRTIGAFGLFFDGAAQDQSYEMKIGRMGVIDGAANVPSPPTDLVVENKVEDRTGVASLRLKWTASPSDVQYYNIYRRDADGGLTYLGGTTLTAHFVPSCERNGEESTTTVAVEAVSYEFGYSSHAVAEFTWEN